MRRARLWLLVLALVPVAAVPDIPADASVSASVLPTNPNYAILAVDGSGVAWGTTVTSPTTIWKSADEGETWTQVTGWSVIGRRPWYVTALPSGTLLVAYDTGTNWAVARSADQGQTWTQVLKLPCLSQDCTLRYTTLTSHSIVAGDGYVFLGTYNNEPGTPWTNYVYRSADDGRTWAVSNTTTSHRHIHGLVWDGSEHRLYVLFGDTAPNDGVWYSTDDGVTLSPLCTDYACVSIEAIIAPSNALVFGTDNPGGTNHIELLDASTGTYTSLASMPYDSYSSNSAGSVWLVAETHEGGLAITDPDIRLYASSDSGTTWSDLYDFAIPNTVGSFEMRVESVFPNGDVVVQVSGQPAVVLRIAGSGGGGSAPANTTPPAITGTPTQGQTLQASNGSWSGSPTAYTYQWQDCNGSVTTCSSIGNANASSYTVQASDVGDTVRVEVTATNAYGSTTAASAASSTATATANQDHSAPSPPKSSSPPTNDAAGSTSPSPPPPASQPAPTGTAQAAPTSTAAPPETASATLPPPAATASMPPTRRRTVAPLEPRPARRSPSRVRPRAAARPCRRSAAPAIRGSPKSTRCRPYRRRRAGVRRRAQSRGRPDEIRAAWLRTAQ